MQPIHSFNKWMPQIDWVNINEQFINENKNVTGKVGYLSDLHYDCQRSCDEYNWTLIVMHLNICTLFSFHVIWCIQNQHFYGIHTTY